MEISQLAKKLSEQEEIVKNFKNGVDLDDRTLKSKRLRRNRTREELLKVLLQWKENKDKYFGQSVGA